MEEGLFVQALSEIEAQVPERGILIPGSLSAEEETIVFDPPVGEPGANLSLDMNQKYHAYYMMSDDLERLGSLTLNSSLPEGYFDLPGSMLVAPLGSPTIGDNGEIAWELTAERSIAENIEEMNIITKVLGKTPDSAIKDICVTDVPMRDYSDEEIRAYVATGDPLDKAGAYAIQHAQFSPVASMDGCYASVMGLPLCHVVRPMRRMGVEPNANVPVHCQSLLEYECPVFESILNE